MSLRVLCAGCTKQEREGLEAEVAAGLGPRVRSEPWTVSLVKIGDRWSVTLEGPDRETRGKTFMAAESRLRQSIAEAVGQGSSGAAPPRPRPAAPPARAGTPAVAGPRGERRDRHSCSKCQKAYIIIYEADAGEATETVPVACPQCWQIDHVTVGQSAGLNSDYRVETVD